MHEFSSWTANQSSQGYCNNYQNKHDDPCPTTVLSLTNLGQCMKFLKHPVLPVHYPVTGQMHYCINFKAINVASARFTDHKKFNMEPVWLFGVVTLEMDSALKRIHAFIQREFLSWPVLCMEIPLHHVHHWPNQNRGSWPASPFCGLVSSGSLM